MSIWKEYIEQFCVFLCLLVLTALCLNFVVRHQLSAGQEVRFLFSGSLLLSITLLLRFVIQGGTALRRASYRIALVMMFWSLGFYWFSSPQWLLYLVTFPAWYFLFRLEVKGNVLAEDLITAGILLGLGSFLYIQQMPLSIILYPQQEFEWQNYIRHSGLFALLGLGFMRLHARQAWPGIFTLGVIQLWLGSGIAVGYFLNSMGISDEWLFLSFALISHALLLFINQSMGLRFLRHFSNINEDHYKKFCSIIFWVVLAGNHALLVFLLRMPFHLVSTLCLFIIPALVFYYREKNIHLLIFSIIEWALIIYPWASSNSVGMWWLWWACLGLLLAFSVLLQRKPQLFLAPPIWLISALFVWYYIYILQYPVASGIGFFLILYPLVFWFSLSDRPVRLAAHQYFWGIPLLTGIATYCYSGSYHAGFWPIWCVANMLLYGAVTVACLQWQNHQAVFRWHNALALYIEKHIAYLLQLLAISSVSTVVAITVHNYWSGIPIAEWYLLFAYTILSIIGSLYCLRNNFSLKHIILTELHIWCFILLGRYWLVEADILVPGSVHDGYFMIIIAAVVAALRGRLNNQAENIQSHLNKTVIFYSLLGWIYILLIYSWNYQLDYKNAHAVMATFMVSAVYFWQGSSYHRRFYPAAMLFLNIAFVLWYFSYVQSHLLYLLTPLVLSVWLLLFISKEIHAERNKNLRFWTVISMLTMWIAFYFSGLYSVNFWPLWCVSNIVIYGIISTVLMQMQDHKLVANWHSAITLYIQQHQAYLFKLLVYTSVTTIVGITVHHYWPDLHLNEWYLLFAYAIAAVIACFYCLRKEISLKHIINTELHIWALTLLIRYWFAHSEVLPWGAVFDGYFMLIVSVIVAGLKERLHDKAGKFQSHLNKTAILYSLLGWVYTLLSQLWNAELELINSHTILATVMMAGLYFWQGRSYNRHFYWAAMIFLNIAISLWFFKAEQTHPLYLLTPVLLSILLLLQLMADVIPPERAKNIRFWTTISMFTLSAFFNVTDFNESIIFPLMALALSICAILLGISLRIRIYLYAGVSFFFANIFGVIAYTILHQPQDKIVLFLGITFFAVGVIFTGLFVFYQMKRAEILEQYNRLKGELASWG